MKRTFRSIIAIVGFVLSISCNASDIEENFSEPQLTPETAFQLAKDKAIEGGYKLERFKLSSLSYDYYRHDWFIGFKEREFTGTLGAHFMVHIKEGEQIEVILDRGI